ncbi:MAG: hypothetical protein MJE77_06335 [Proteobacteria bacterium]|nr:hypothetical protein [Pseudomonadota bacterium]
MAFVLVSAVGCGSEIGDSCTVSNDCSNDGDRICLRSGEDGMPGGYCTIRGCDFDTCPDEAVCVRFFAVGESDKSCNPKTEDSTEDACAPEEFCTLAGSCVPRTAEIRYCMRKCGGNGDCRDEYECRDKGLMLAHGGEPVASPDRLPDDDPQPFCAVAPL